MHVIWTGERIRLRPFKDADEHVNMLEELSLEEDQFWGYSWWIRSRLNAQFEKDGAIGEPGSFSVFAIERLDTSELIGYEVAEIPRSGDICVEIGTVLLQRHWSKGFGREAKLLAMCFLFENYTLSCIGAVTLGKHQRAVAGLEACQMTYEGRERLRAFSMGRREDVLFYRIFREEWERLPIRQVIQRGWSCT